MATLRTFLRKPLVAAALGAIVAMIIAPVAAVAAQSVFISNDDAHPVPVKAIGTTSVSGSVGITNGDASSIPVHSVGTTTVSGDVTVDNLPTQPQPWQKVVPLQWSEGQSVAAAFVNVDPATALTVEHVSLPDLFGRDVAALSVEELCDFGDGQSGFGGGIFVPISEPKSGADNAIDHLSQLHITPGACYEVLVGLTDPMPPGSFMSTSLTLSGTSTSVPSQSSQPATKQDLQRSLRDPAYVSAVGPEAARASRQEAASA